MTETAPEFLTVDQFADLIGVPVRTIKHWVSEGTAPPSAKLGRHRRFRRVDIEAWIDERTDQPERTAAT